MLPILMTRPCPGASVEELVRNAWEGETKALIELLLRRGGLPGPRPNIKLALSAAQGLAGGGEKGHGVLDAWRLMGEAEAPVGTAYPILPMVGVLGYGFIASRASCSDEFERALATLHQHADDNRREVRQAVVTSLTIAMQGQSHPTLEALHGWTDGYFHAEVMLQALSEPSVLQATRDADLVLERLQDAYTLVSDAPRSHQRSHGYRALVRTMSHAVAAIGRRYPQPVVHWIEQQVQGSNKDLLDMLHASLRRLRDEGLRRGDVQSIYQAIDAAEPAPRDPRWNVGPTRGRGKKIR